MRGRHGKGPQAAVRWSLATARRAKSTPHGGHGGQLARLGRESDRSTCLRRVTQGHRRGDGGERGNSRSPPGAQSSAGGGADKDHRS